MTTTFISKSSQKGIRTHVLGSVWLSKIDVSAKLVYFKAIQAAVEEDQS